MKLMIFGAKIQMYIIQDLYLVIALFVIFCRDFCPLCSIQPLQSSYWKMTSNMLERMSETDRLTILRPHVVKRSHFLLNRSYFFFFVFFALFLSSLRCQKSGVKKISFQTVSGLIVERVQKESKNGLSKSKNVIKLSKNGLKMV